MKDTFFGPGDITNRLIFKGWRCRLEFKLADFWVGVFWKTVGHCLDVWICVVPCLPLHLCFIWHDPEQ
jgi:hypothetical protein